MSKRPRRKKAKAKSKPAPSSSRRKLLKTAAGYIGDKITGGVIGAAVGAVLHRAVTKLPPATIRAGGASATVSVTATGTLTVSVSDAVLVSESLTVVPSSADGGDERSA
jgi:hypothetical protein